MASPEVLRLTRLDQTMLRVYVRQLLVFPFPDFCSKEEAQATLAASLLVTLKQFPFLAGTVEQTEFRTGALSVRYPSNIDPKVVSQLLTTIDLDTSKLDFEDLCHSGVPPSQLPSDVFCPVVLRSHPGTDDPFVEGLTMFTKGLPIPVFAAQISFISNGLVLSAYTHHSVVDGSGIAKIYQVWSAHTRTYGRGMKVPQQKEGTKLNHARHALDSLTTNAPTMKLPEFRFPGDPINPPLRDNPYKLSAKILVFSASTITKLAASLSTITKGRISTFTALTALIWSQITNARRDAMIEKGVQKTTVGIAIDHRKRVGQLIPSDYIGNCANGMTVSLPLAAILTSHTMDEEHIAPVALAISNGLSEIDLDWFRARLSIISKQENSSKLLLNVDTRNGPDIFITSWMHIGADDLWAIGGTVKVQSEHGDMRRWFSKPTAIRKPQCQTEGGIQILPRRKGDEAPFEILCCLEEGEMERTMQGLQEREWVERVVDG